MVWWISIAFAIILVLIIVPPLTAGYMIRRFCRVRKFSYGDTLDHFKTNNISHGDPRIQYNWQEFSFFTFDGLELKGHRLQVSDRRVMVMVHGHRSQWLSMTKYVPRLIAQGWSIIAYDQRYYGESQGDFSSGGLLEKRDLRQLLEIVRQWHPGAEIGLFGESMGSAILLQALEEPTQAGLAVAVCPFSDLETLFRYHLGRKGMIGFAQEWAMVWCRHLFRRTTGGEISQVSPRNSVSSAAVPILLLHGTDDSYVPPSMSEEIHQRNLHYTELILVPRGTHAHSFMRNPEVFWSGVESFLKKNAP